MDDIFRSASDPDDIECVETGHFRVRTAKGAPWQPLRIIRVSGRWVALLCGKAVEGSGAEKAKDVPFLLWRSPFHRITEQAYAELLAAYETAPPGHPLRQPGEKIDLRNAPASALYRGKIDG